MRKKGHDNSKDDDRLWETVTSQINPLNSVRYSGAREKALADQKTTSPRKIARRTAEPMTAKNAASFAKTIPIDLREGDHAGLDKTTRRKLANGNVPVEARIDLHGHNAHEAEIRVRAFIQQSFGLGHRCVLVITGKGIRGEGVLRRHVPLWLKQPPLDGIVLAISNATPNDGGTGAIYVMLRRTRASK